MALVWTGPFSDTDIPAAQRFTGWSNFNDDASATALKLRYRDGDPASAFIWREMYGNANYQLATSNRGFHLAFVRPTSANPTKGFAGTDWSDREAIYAIVGPVGILPNGRRGVSNPPRFSVRMRARRTGGSATHHARVYAFAYLRQCAETWPLEATRAAGSGDGMVDFSISSSSYPASPGLATAQTLFLDVARLGGDGTYSRQVWTHPASTALSGTGIDQQDVDVMVTYFVIAAIGDGGTEETQVAAVQIHEEPPGG